MKKDSLFPGQGSPFDVMGGDSSGTGQGQQVTWTGATTITTAGTFANGTYTSTTDAECALLVTASGSVTLTNPTVTKSGGPTNASDNYSFYGINSGITAKDGGTLEIKGGTITTTAVGANAVFSYGGNGGTNGAAGDGTTVYISDTVIRTYADGSGGIMTTGGGAMVASNVTAETDGQSSAAIRTDRGGGTVTVDGGSYISNGLGSPAIYSTADITVANATLTSNLSEGVCIEGQNSVTLNNCTLTANNTQTNGNAQFLDAVILYQSMSGDSSEGTATFSMTGGTLVNKSGHIFHVTNTNAIINLDGVAINDSGDGVFLSVCDDGWSGANNIATLNLSGQNLDGNILVGDDSSLTLNITDSSTFTGNISGEIVNAKGSTVSTEIGTVNVTLDDTSTWYLDADTYITSFNGSAANVITNGHTLYVDDVALDGTSTSDDSGGDADVVPAWFDADLYMENKLEQLGDDWNEQSMIQAFNDAGYSGKKGYYQHFLDWGNKENVSPNKYFDSDFYFQDKLDQLQKEASDQGWTMESTRQAFEDANLSAWDHYRLYGINEAIDPCDTFSTSKYLEAKLDALHRDDPSGNWTMDSMIAAFQQAVLNPVQHYVLYGVNENLDFDPDAGA
ncbi:MAG: hypothetical protein K6G15_07980 [Desulfovibrio sp.]|nr:hypothetical protein [Desulfovibrio sp.]